jgi:hypothetical protein
MAICCNCFDHYIDPEFTIACQPTHLLQWLLQKWAARASSVLNWLLGNARRTRISPNQAFVDFLVHPQPYFDIEATVGILKSDPEGVVTASGLWMAFNNELKDGEYLN